MVDALERAALDSGAATMLENIEEIVASRRSPGTPTIPPFWSRSDSTQRHDATLEYRGQTRRKSSSTTPPAILDGEVHSVAVVGAEAMYARLLARREGRELDWTLQRDDS